MRPLTVVFLASFFLVAWVGTGNTMLSEDDLQAQTKEVAKTLRCAVCQSESVWESNAELALQMREIIRERLQQGESPNQIRAYFVSRYGDFILLKPRPIGLNWLLWGGPFILLFIGAIILLVSIRSWTRDTLAVPLEKMSDLTEEDQKKIDLAIRTFKN
ncbi:MAG: cytochrome c-type biogenesis protein CcmH [Nitrospirae bacterium]|nr:cytochrome c-type biogenesis protein CcmH [Nitrospirota bacterium]MBI3594205.1 cytochrome c-type biogenesis protein CcmH [Nitrospirota bacterium]